MRELFIKKIVTYSCLFCVILIISSGCSLQNEENNPISYGIGWNLGNTLDSVDFRQEGSVEYYETLWGNPITTKQMIDAVKEAGFKAVRVPVTWYDHVDEG